MKRAKKIFMLTIIALQLLTAGFGMNFESYENESLKMGSMNENVKVLQQALKVAGSYKEVELSDYYGDKTKDAVMHFQLIYGLETDGVVGRKTLDKISEYEYWPILHKNIYKEGMNDKDIVTLQAALHTAGFLKTTEFTEQFDELVYDSIKAFQREHGLEDDGIAGNNTIKKMMELNLIISDYEEVDQQNQVFSSNAMINRGTVKRFGEYISWSEVHKLFDVGTKIRIKDFYTGIEFDAMVGHGSNHADIEPLTKADSAKMKAAWGGEHSWARRPVLVYYKNRVFAASLNGMPHAGVDSKPALERVSNRSAGYGTGTNYDLVKGNGMDGHICLHFKGSKLHTGNKSDPKHQESVRIAAGL